VSQRTIRQNGDPFKFLREAPQLPFSDLLNANLARGMLRHEK
jgi:hypothetical protein